MAAYEVRFYRTNNAFSVVYLATFASDRDAKSSVSLLLHDDLPFAAISQDGRHVAHVLHSLICDALAA
jgi:hypothetical protein